MGGILTQARATRRNFEGILRMETLFFIRKWAAGR
jgi:hypothetical protein